MIIKLALPALGPLAAVLVLATAACDVELPDPSDYEWDEDDESAPQELSTDGARRCRVEIKPLADGSGEREAHLVTVAPGGDPVVVQAKSLRFVFALDATRGDVTIEGFRSWGGEQGDAMPGEPVARVTVARGAAHASEQVMANERVALSCDP